MHRLKEAPQWLAVKAVPSLLAIHTALSPGAAAAQEPIPSTPDQTTTVYLPYVEQGEAEPTDKQFEVATTEQLFSALSYAESHGNVNVLIILTAPELQIGSEHTTHHARQRISPDNNPAITDARLHRSAIYIPPRTGKLHITSSVYTTLSFDAADTDAIIYAEMGTDITLSNLQLRRTGIESSADGLALLTRYTIVGDALFFNNVNLTNASALAAPEEPFDPNEPDPRLVGGVKAFGPVTADNLTISGIGWDGMVTVGQASLRNVGIHRDAASRDKANLAGTGVAMFLEDSSGTENQLSLEQVQTTNYLKGTLIIDTTGTNQPATVEMRDVTLNMTDTKATRVAPIFYYVLSTINVTKLNALLVQIAAVSNGVDSHGTFSLLNTQEVINGSIVISDSEVVCDAASLHPIYFTEGPGYCTEVPHLDLLSGNASITIFHRPNQLFYLDDQFVPLSMYVTALKARGFSVTPIEVRAVSAQKLDSQKTTVYQPSKNQVTDRRQQTRYRPKL